MLLQISEVVTYRCWIPSSFTPVILKEWVKDEVINAAWRHFKLAGSSQI
jgi:hypothetical protein